MARRRSARVNAVPGGQPSLATAIFLVFTILICLTLGVFLFLERSKTTQALNDKARADQEVSTLKPKLLQRNEEIVVLAGGALGKENIQLLQEEFPQAIMRDQSRQDAGSDKHPAFIAARNLLFGDKDKGTVGLLGQHTIFVKDGKPNSDPRLTDIPTQLKERIRLLEDDVKFSEERLRKKEDEFKGMTMEQMANVNEQVKNYQKLHNPDTLKQRIEEIQKLHEEKVTSLVADIKNLQAKFDADLKKTQAEVDRILLEERTKLEAILNTEKAKLDSEREQMRLQREKEMSERRSRETIAVNEPKGQIIREGERLDRVFVNVGQRQRVQEGLTFSVHGMGPGNRPLPDPKANIRIISVLDVDLSLAEITRIAKPEQARDRDVNPTNDKYWITDPKLFYTTREPLRKGDLLFNPGWRPNQKVHVAINGVIDLNNDGIDDSETLRRILKERGIEVDAYLDRAEGYVIRGKVDHNTEFLIQGSTPSYPKAKPEPAKPEAPEGGIPPAAAKEVARNPFQELEYQSIGRGLQVVNARRFLTQMGFMDLKIIQTDDKAAAAVGAGVQIPAGPRPVPPIQPKPGAGGAEMEKPAR